MIVQEAGRTGDHCNPRIVLLRTNRWHYLANVVSFGHKELKKLTGVDYKHVQLIEASGPVKPP